MLIIDTNNANHIARLINFSKLDHPSTFRYFKNRGWLKAIQTHVFTVLYECDGKDIGYAHIDKEGDRHYVGLCVMPDYQNKGIGTRLLKFILKLVNTDLYLTVDSDNVRAISLYKKHGFQHIDENLYKRTVPLYLEVSVGEGIDKLTILDIKLDKIKNEDKRLACKKEYDAIYPTLEQTLKKCKFLYSCLKYINLQIWNLQDDVREHGKTVPNLLEQILDLNDMRFRVKKRINQIAHSSLHEQKGYSDKVGLFVGHMGMGDLINLNGAIRYASLCVDHLFVVCRKMYVANLKSMIGDDTNIEIIECEDHVNDVYSIKKKREINGRTLTNWFISGNWLDPNRELIELPKPFYSDLNFPYEVRHTFFHYDRKDELPVPEVPYVFVHLSSANTTTSNMQIEIMKNILVIDPSTNHYPESHEFHSIAQQYVGKPILKYGSVIENAEEIHVTDSAFYCLASLLKLKATFKRCYDRSTGNINRLYNFE